MKSIALPSIAALVLFSVNTLFLTQGVAAYAEEKSVLDWQPQHDDKPVSANHLAALEEALPERSAAGPKKERKILVFSATQKFRHNSIPLGKVALARLGEKTGAYTTVVSDDPANFELEELRTFDGVVLLSPTGDFFMPNPKEKESFTEEEWQQLKQRHERLVDNLITFVKGGGGLTGIHSATDACYGHHDYGTTIGGYFAGHPWNWKSNVTIVVEEPDHPTIKPVFRGRDYFELVEEIYIYRKKPNPRTNNRVLLSLDPERSDPVDRDDIDKIDVPVAWVQAVGEGRVFYTSIGHNHHIFTNPLVLRHYLTGIQFAIGDIDGPTAPREARR
ncbi:MAG: hypothetical protein GVY36_11395 [Verrucomicrobia bacterium]|jgi:type 1 glutamine amidotransferase|nr:hypothetical protein [Verrucomicrobiota bacterium]